MTRLFPLCPALIGLFLTMPHSGAETARAVVGATGIPRLWQPQQHLYVKGETGLPADRLEALETWLDAHAPHWTVVLLNGASGESWQDPGGRQLAGMDAVEHALGQQLPAETAFGSFTHPQTGERDGAWLVIFLRERQFSYWAADAYDRRSLGEDHWQGNLDSAAKQAMRGGGRVVDAVQDTITSIDGELKRRIAQEAEAGRQQAARQERLRVRTGEILAETRLAVQRCPGQAGELRRNWPGASGDLANPPVDPWLSSLTEAETLGSAGQWPGASALVEKVRGEVEAWDAACNAHRSAPVLLQNLQQEMDGMALHPWSGAARAGLLTARGLLRDATAAHAKGEAGYATMLEKARQGLAAGRASDAATRRLAAEHARLTARAEAARYPNSAMASGLVSRARTALEAFPAEREAGGDGEQWLRQAEDSLQSAQQTADASVHRAQVIRRASQAGGVAATTALLLTGWAGNRRRRKVKDRATAIFQQWEEALRKKTTELFALLDKAGSTVGNAGMLERSGWSGTTRELAAGAIRDVDQLFVMSSAMDQVLEQARAFIQPKNPLARGRNLVSGGPYQKALQLLEEKLLQFGPESQIPAILRTSPELPWRGLLGRREDCEPFTLTFSGLNAAFNGRAARAVDALNRVGTAWTQLSDSLTELEHRMASVALLEKQVNAAASVDRRFGMEAIFAVLLPAARADGAAAASIGLSDPVQALESPWAEGSRKTSDALALCQAALGFRSSQLPGIQESGQLLIAAGRQTGWIGAALDELSTAAGSMATAASSRSIKEDLAAWETATRNWGNRAQEAVELTQRAATGSLPALQSLEARIQAVRTRLAATLGLLPEKILTESGRNPSEGWAAARRCQEAALTELDRGDTAAARGSLEEAAHHIGEANGLVEQAVQAQAGHAARMQFLTHETGRLTGLLPEHSSVLDALIKGWAPAALKPAAADLTYPDPDESVADNLRRAEDLLVSARDRTQSGAEAFRGGALLASVDCLNLAGADLVAVTSQLEAIIQQRDAIVAAHRANATEAERLARHRSALQALADEPVTMMPTRETVGMASAQLEAAAAGAALTGPAADPFAAAKDLAAASLALTEAGQRLQADREVFGEATRSVAHAERQLAAALPLMRQAGGDGIPDSPGTVEAQDKLVQLREALSGAEAALEESHRDWNAVNLTADQIAADAATWRARLQGELALATASVETLQRAAERVRAAGGWSGTLGVRITGIPGQARLESARRALNQGDYATAHHEGESALREARQAIQTAEAEERRRRQEQEQQEESRRRAAAQRRASAFSSSSGSSSGSSSSRSSFSSGSGASRSGW